MYLAFVSVFVVLPLVALLFSVGRTLRGVQTGEVVLDTSAPASRWGDRVGPSLREHQLQAEAKTRHSPFAEPRELPLMARQRPVLGAAPARLRQPA